MINFQLNELGILFVLAVLVLVQRQAVIFWKLKYWNIVMQGLI